MSEVLSSLLPPAPAVFNLNAPKKPLNVFLFALGDILSPLYSNNENKSMH